jgi:DnaD and phage-associated domain
MIDPNFWESIDVWKLTIRQRLLAIALFSLADDEGRGLAEPLLLKVKVFPHDDEVKVRDIEDDLRNIERNLSIVLYEIDGKKFYAWKNWTKWQKVEKKTKSVIPGPPEGNIPQPFGENSGNSRGEVGKYSEPNIIEENMKIIEGEGDNSNDHVTLDPPRGISGKNADADADEGKHLFYLFENEFGRPVTPLEVDQINAWLTESGPDLTREALRRAVLQGKLNFRYIDRILLGWQKQNLRTLREVAEKDPLDRGSRAVAGQNGETNADLRPRADPRADPEIERQQWVQAAIQYIRSTMGEKPDRKKARRIAEGYGPDVAAEVMKILFGGDEHGKPC